MAPLLGRAELVTDRSISGLQLCRSYSHRVDEWLAALFADAGAPDGCALVAVGGFGRSELSPRSDIDLVLVHTGRRDIGSIAEKIWYPIWDEGLKLGHAVRTTREAMALAADDLETATSLLSARLVAGDADLADELAAKALGLWQKRSKRFLTELSRTVKDRHARVGEVAFLLEPDLKEGRGGLRDAHAIRWAEQAETVMLEGDDDVLDAAYSTLLEARVELHRTTNRSGDTLALQDQDVVSESLGYGSADALMRAVSAAARDIAWTSDEVWYRIDSSLKGPSSIRLRRDKPLAPGIVLREGEIHITSDADIVGDTRLPLRAAVLAAQNDAHLDRSSLWRLAGEAGPVPFEWNEEARALFASLLLAGSPAIGVIEALDRKGLWVRFVPEWEPVRCRPQRNAYHTYTVDRHLCVAAVNAASLADRVDRPDLLVVGTLLHDIGKGYAGDHTQVGVDMIGTIASRMGYPADDIAVLQDMVRLHLLLPDVATRRDLDDDETIQKVADQIGSLKTLRLLHALTEADSQATGPAAWNSWKADLVNELVSRAAHVLGGGRPEDVTGEIFPTVDLLQRMDAGKLDLAAEGNRVTVVAPDRPGLFSRVTGVLALHGLDVLQARAYSNDDGMAVEAFKVESAIGPVIPWDGVLRDLELALQGRLALHARLADRARSYARPRFSTPPPAVAPRVLVDLDTSTTATVVEVHCPDAIGVLSRITDAIAELDLDIKSAKVQTLGDQVVDSFYLRDRDGERV
ncbi:MAG: [protein-PII] uridylyltransferase, partial [Actinobacteria bacterium]|nr:[protein-PII] uridylyltransferase [Actinomycetota bacterium]